MDAYQDLLDQVRETVDSIRRLTDAALEQYTSLVDAVIAGTICEQQEIERIMDGLLDFGDDIRFLDVYRKLCRHVYHTYPELVGEHIALWRLQFEGADENQPEDQAEDKHFVCE